MRRISDTLARLAKFQPPSMPSAGGAGGSDRLGTLTGFGSNPGALQARLHVPEGLKPGAALVVALHGCTQTAAGYDHGTGWSDLADAEGFVVLLPEQARGNNANVCFNWFEPGDIRRTGGEAESIAQMIRATIAQHGIDPTRVFVTGLSAGGAMTAVMLATYPELFAGGAIIGGLPYGSASNVSQALDRMRGHGLAGDEAAAAAVRAAGKTTRWPRVSVWHGSADSTVTAANMDRLTGQWRTVHGLPAAPDRVETGPRWERRVWADAAGRDAVEQWAIAGMGHGVPVDPAALGHAGPYMLDVGLSSTLAIARSWGLTERVSVERTAEEPATASSFPEMPSLGSMPAGVQDTIDRAMRAAGLMR
ncbi:PHB depolymerase family esterase [Microvirga sp. SRT01]|uniref:PHB depolymerase family esterase n=1 Tax=Sphingomonas longa TaxID=2778730 RepID=A0ABS2D9E9_9SPHN|nr:MULTISPECIES: PHB depolymerase family esterase [Alphaproteobacteria]MBM6577550.1 PHB depolymerase family esterase [Sphingomonas sp. BT552]MBR7710595.1 PHB depolymerase family esterase [Microvirga sp. SRT01]